MPLMHNGGGHLTELAADSGAGNRQQVSHLYDALQTDAAEPGQP
jgi:hypothetical protein